MSKKVSIILLITFFLSSISALTYEVVWARKLGLVFGTTAYAISTVLAVFFAGLALGSIIFGKIADWLAKSSEKTLFLFGLIELGIGLYALFTPQIFKLIEKAQIAFWQRYELSFSGFSLATLVFSFLGLIIPCILIGGTFPVISKYWIRFQEKLGQKIGILYFLDTAGALTGAALAGFILVIWLGVNGAIYAAAGLNGLIGITVLGLAMSQKIGEPLKVSSVKNQELETKSWLAIILIGFFFSGFAAMSLEVLWTRVLVMILGSSTYAFSIILITFLFGMAVGSLIISKFIGKPSSREISLLGKFKKGLLWFSATQILIGLSVLATIPLFNKLPFLFFDLLQKYGQSFWTLQLVEFFLLFLVMLLPTLLMGATFPIVVNIYTKEISALAGSVGKVYGFNTLGGVFGSLATGFLLIPLIGIQKSIVISALIYFLVGSTILILTPLKSKTKFSLLAILILLGVFGFYLPVWEKNILTSGVFIYGDLYLWPQPTEIIFYKEGLSSIVSLRRSLRDGSLVLQINGKADASDRGDLPTELLSGHLAMIFHPLPKEVLVIGLGSGITLGAVEQYQELEKVEAIEIEPAVVEAAKFFSESNNNALEDQRLNLIIGDGRNYLLATDKKYDVITAEPSNLWISGMGNLFSQEYFEMMKSRLKDGGIVLQWVHLYRIGEEDLRTVIRTFQSVFPKMTVWTTEPEMKDLLLIGFREKEEIDLNLLEERFGQEKIKKDLSRISIDKPSQIFGFFLLDSQATEKFVGKGSLHTDNHPILEFSTPKSFYAQILGSNLKRLKDFQTSPFAILTEVSPEEKKEIEEYFEYRKDMIESSILLGEKNLDGAISILEKSLSLYPQYQPLRERLVMVYYQKGEELSSLGKKEEALKIYQKILDLDPNEAQAHILSGEIYIELRKPDEAEKEVKEAIRLYDLSSTAHMFMGVVYGMKNNLVEAEKELKRSIELNPKNYIAHNNLAHLYQLQGRKEEAIREWKESLKISPNQPEIKALLRNL